MPETIDLEVAPDGIHLDDVQRQVLIYALVRFGGNARQAARWLHMAESNLRRRLKRLGLTGVIEKIREEQRLYEILDQLDRQRVSIERLLAASTTQTNDRRRGADGRRQPLLRLVAK